MVQRQDFDIDVLLYQQGLNRLLCEIFRMKKSNYVRRKVKIPCAVLTLNLPFSATKSLSMAVFEVPLAHFSSGRRATKPCLEWICVTSSVYRPGGGVDRPLERRRHLLPSPFSFMSTTTSHHARKVLFATTTKNIPRPWPQRPPRRHDWAFLTIC